LSLTLPLAHEYSILARSRF